MNEAIHIPPGIDAGRSTDAAADCSPVSEPGPHRMHGGAGLRAEQALPDPLLQFAESWNLGLIPENLRVPVNRDRNAWQMRDCISSRNPLMTGARMLPVR
jgi:hypothetical protein